MAKLSDVFFKNLDAYQAGEKLIINQGGQGSSKTYSILQLIYLIAKKEAYRITIASYALPHLKDGAISDFNKILYSFNENPDLLKTGDPPVYKIGNSVINFFGIEGNVAKAHGPRREILFINEINHKVTYDVYDQLASRTEIVKFIDFNPDQEFWLHEKIIPNFKHTLIKSNFPDNPWLPDGELQNILMKKDKPGFENWWRVYGLGELGKLEGVIYPNWRFGEFDNSLPYAFGLDFGFHPDPDALVKIAIDHKNKKIYLKECFYLTGQKISQLKVNVGLYVLPHELIVADSAEPRLIEELRVEGFNIEKAYKPDGSVIEGIRIVQNYELIVDPDSNNTAKELNNYIWNNKRAGIPIDGFNHILDPVRYVTAKLTKSNQGSEVLGFSVA